MRHIVFINDIPLDSVHIFNFNEGWALFRDPDLGTVVAFVRNGGHGDDDWHLLGWSVGGSGAFAMPTHIPRPTPRFFRRTAAPPTTDR